MNRIALLAFALIIGCGASAQETATTIVAHSARAGVAVDEFYAAQYQDAARRALQSAATLPEYRSMMTPWDAGVSALVLLRESVLAAERVIAAWDHGGERDWPHVAACIAGALLRVKEALDFLDLTPPSQLLHALEIGLSFGDASCQPGVIYE